MVISGSPIMSSGAGGGDSMEELAAQLMAELGLTAFFQQALDDLNLDLTSGARLMLLIPLAEINRLERPQGREGMFSFGEQSLAIDRRSVEESLTKLLIEMAQSPAAADRSRTETRSLRDRLFIQENPLRTSISAIKAYWSRFCNIPPFCSETKE